MEMTNPLKQTTRWKYNALGECTEVINPLGNKQQFEYNRLGRLSKVKLPNSEIIDLKYDAYDSILRVNSLHSKINYTYTPLGSIRSREEKGVKFFFEYDVQERLTALSNEKGEKYQFSRNQRGDIVREVSFDGINRYYKRDKAGKVVRIKRGTDRFTEYEYDKGGRITRAEYHDGSWETFSYDQAGRLIEARNSKTAVSFKRNRDGKILQEKQGEHLLDYLYDKDGNLVEVKSSLGANINYTRDAFGQISGIQAGDKENLWIAKIKRNMLGLEVERTLPGGVKSSWSYDENNLPLSQKVESYKFKSGLHKNYQWNASQQLQQITNALTHGETTFAYDAFGSLASARYEDGSFDYKLPDEIGNLFRETAKQDRKYGRGG
ncbi:RHS repeat domain-containing protein [Apibacter muscae]